MDINGLKGVVGTPMHGMSPFAILPAIRKELLQALETTSLMEFGTDLIKRKTRESYYFIEMFGEAIIFL